MNDEIKLKKKDGYSLVFIPDSMWKCPKCGKGEPGELVYDPGYEYEEAPLAEDGWLVMGASVECEAKDEEGKPCAWYGAVRQVYNRLTKKLDIVTCPCCKGKGVVSTKVAAKFKESKK